MHEPGPEACHERTNRRDLLLALALTALAALLRLYHLAEPSLWIDESLSMTDAWNALDGSSSQPPPNYPVSYALILLGLKLIGWNEIGARLLPCLVGVATVPALYAWVRSNGTRETATWSALLLALSPWHLLQSQNARYYTLLALLTLLFAVFSTRWLRHRCLWDLAATVACLAVGILTHPAAAFSLPVLPWLFWRERRRRGSNSLVPRSRRGKVILSLIGLAFLASLPYFASALRPHFTSKAGFSFILHLTTLAWHAGVVFLTVAAGGIALAWKTRESFATIVATHAVTILVTATLASFLVRVNQQYVVATLPFACILVAQVLVAVRRHASPMLSVILCCAVGAEELTGDFLYHGPLHGFRPRWREAAESVARGWQPGDLIASNRPTVLEAYLNPGQRDLRMGNLVLGLSRWNDRVLVDLMQRSSRVWYVVEDGDLVEWEARDAESFRVYLARRCHLVTDFPMALGPKDLNVKVYLHDSGSTTFE